MRSTPKHSKKTSESNLKHVFEYEQFILWVATPKQLRVPKTQRELAIDFGVGEDTLSEWKNRPDFTKKVAVKVKEFSKDKTTDVVHALYSRILRNGDPAAVRLWLQYVEGWADKSSMGQEEENSLASLTDSELAAAIKEAQDVLLKKV